MTTTAAETDIGFGLGLALSIIALVGALATTYFGYAAATGHSAGRAAQINGGIAFGVAVFAGALAVAAFHAFER